MAEYAKLLVTALGSHETLENGGRQQLLTKAVDSGCGRIFTINKKYKLFVDFFPIICIYHTPILISFLVMTVNHGCR